MSLLLNEDFTTYQLRLAYLQGVHDGVGERLINLNTSVLNNPAFRAAGWLPDTAAIKRCYSPPIPTTSINNEYFQAPNRSNLGLPFQGGEVAGNVGGGGMVTGNVGSEDTLGPGGFTERRRQKRRQQLEEEDSSDLSDESDDEEARAAQQIKFNKMPVRRRSRSDIASEGERGTATREESTKPELMVTSPSKPPDEERAFPVRRTSLGTTEAQRQRLRRDTTTSSEMSSENEFDTNSAFSKKLPGRPQKHAAFLHDKIQEEDPPGEDDALDGPGDSDEEDEDVGEASDLSDEFDGTVDSSILALHAGADAGLSNSPLKPPPDMPPAITPHGGSPRKSSKDNVPKLATLPLGRPISTVMPKSLLSMALKGGNGGGEKPFQRYADLSGKGESSPLWIKIYAPFSGKASSPLQVPIRRTKDDKPVTVAELIGLALWRYSEEEYDPPISGDLTNINRWTLRMVEDEEVDMDFPPLVRTRPVSDFTSNNNRPPQRRARDKPWDEFGLVKASETEFQSNEKATPHLGGDTVTSGINTPKPEQSRTATPAPAQRSDTVDSVPHQGAPSFTPNRNPITGPAFALTTTKKDSSNLLDAPQHPAATSTPRMGAAKTVSIHFTDPQSFSTTLLPIPTTADTYIAELFDIACKRLNLDKALHVLKVRGTQTVAPSDRTVEALGDRLHLDLVRRRFAAGAGDGIFGLGLSGSPGSTSPNAPLMIATNTPPLDRHGKAKKKGLQGFVHPLQPKTEAWQSTMNLAALGPGAEGKRFNVLRRQPLSFSSSHPRTLVITPEYMTILPAASDSSALPNSGKVTNVHMSSIVGVKVSRKHPKMVRVLVYREKETKRYDFEAQVREEANEICEDIKRGIEAFGDG